MLERRKAKQYTLSTELCLLCRCDLASDAELSACVAASRHHIDWRRFLALVSFNAMGALVHARLSGIAEAALPKFLSDYLADRHRHHMLVQLLQVTETARLVELFSHARIPSIVLKGVSIAHQLYQPHTYWRYSSDIDLLVGPDAFLDADRVLVVAGYRREWPIDGFPKRDQDMLFHLVHAFTYVHSEHGLVVELHHRLTENPFRFRSTFAQTLSETQEITLPGGAIRALDGPLLISYLAWHALGHHEYRLKWFSDLRRALFRTDFTARSTLLARCEEIGAGSAVRLARVITNILYGTDCDRLPEQPAESVGVSSGSRDVTRILNNLDNATAHPPRMRSLAQHTADLSYLRFWGSLCDDPRARKFDLVRELSNPEDVLTLGLTRRWQWGYIILGPLLAAARYLRITSRHGSD